MTETTNRDSGGGASERTFVQNKRAQRASWSAIAGMLGMSEKRVRLLYGPDAVPVVTFTAPPPAWRPTTRREQTLVYLSDGPVGRRFIADHHKWSENDCSMVLNRLKAQNLIQNPGRVWSLTPEGVKYLENLERSGG